MPNRTTSWVGMMAVAVGFLTAAVCLADGPAPPGGWQQFDKIDEKGINESRCCTKLGSDSCFGTGGCEKDRICGRDGLNCNCVNTGQKGQSIQRQGWRKHGSECSPQSSQPDAKCATYKTGWCSWWHVYADNGCGEPICSLVGVWLSPACYEGDSPFLCP